MDRPNYILSPIDSIKTEQQHQKDIIREHSNDIRELSNRVNTLKETITKLDATLPYLITELKDTVIEFQEFKTTFIDKQLKDQERQYQKELLSADKRSEINAKVKLMWAGIGVVLAGIATALIRIFFIRFSA